MRRLFSLLAASLLSTLLLMATTVVAFASDADELSLAAEEAPAGEEGVEPGPSPNPTSSFAPAEYESNFLWGAALGLLVLTAGGIFAIAALYYLLVWRPRHRQESEAP